MTVPCNETIMISGLARAIQEQLVLPLWPPPLRSDSPTISLRTFPLKALSVCIDAPTLSGPVVLGVSADADLIVTELNSFCPAECLCL